jgi:hypothetical protein
MRSSLTSLNARVPRIREGVQEIRQRLDRKEAMVSEEAPN